jgi:hypothetical protein
MRNAAHILLVLVFVGSSARAQFFTDADKRSFTDLTPIRLDVDADRILDTIQPRTFSVTKPGGRSKRPQVSVQHWISFDLKITNGRTIKSFFQYKYGTDLADYWVYALVKGGDPNQDGRPDLMFYTGDDTSHETVILLNKGNAFVARSSGVLTVEHDVQPNLEIAALNPYDAKTGSVQPTRTVAQWNPKREVFEGTEMVWVRTPRVAIRMAPRSSARVLLQGVAGDAFRVVKEPNAGERRAGWLHVDTGAGAGWIRNSTVEYHSPLTVP